MFERSFYKITQAIQARKYSKTFGISLTYLYLCRQITKVLFL